MSIHVLVCHTVVTRLVENDINFYILQNQITYINSVSLDCYLQLEIHHLLHQMQSAVLARFLVFPFGFMIVIQFNTSQRNFQKATVDTDFWRTWEQEAESWFTWGLQSLNFWWGFTWVLKSLRSVWKLENSRIEEHHLPDIFVHTLMNFHALYQRLE